MRLSVTARIALLAIALALISNLVLVAFVWRQIHDDAIDALRRDTIEQSDALVAVWRTGGLPALHRAIEEARAPGDLSLIIAVIDADGRRVAGIGPKLAVTILSGMEADTMVAAIKGNNVAALTRIPGIGKKTAERMVLELRDKLDAFGIPAAVAVVSPVEEDVISALVNLGYQRPVAERALARVERTPGESFDGLFRKAMAALAK